MLLRPVIALLSYCTTVSITYGVLGFGMSTGTGPILLLGTIALRVMLRSNVMLETLVF